MLHTRTCLSRMLSNKKIFITNHIPQIGIDILQNASCNIDYRNEETPISEEALFHKIKDCDGILCTLVDKIDRKVVCSILSN